MMLFSVGLAEYIHPFPHCQNSSNICDILQNLTWGKPKKFKILTLNADFTFEKSTTKNYITKLHKWKRLLLKTVLPSQPQAVERRYISTSQTFKRIITKKEKEYKLKDNCSTRKWKKYQLYINTVLPRSTSSILKQGGSNIADTIEFNLNSDEYRWKSHY